MSSPGKFGHGIRGPDAANLVARKAGPLLASIFQWRGLLEWTESMVQCIFIINRKKIFIILSYRSWEHKGELCQNEGS